MEVTGWGSENKYVRLLDKSKSWLEGVVTFKKGVS